MTKSSWSAIVIAKMKIEWTFNDGERNHPCMTFPYAFRFMFNALKKATEAGQSRDVVVQRYQITSPVGTSYDFKRACDLATQQGLLTSEGDINSREFKRK